MGKSAEVTLEIAGGGAETVRLRTNSVQKWPDILADLQRLFPDLHREGGVSKGFKYKGAFGREKIVDDEDSLQRFFKHALEADEFTHAVVLAGAASAAYPAAADATARTTPVASTSTPTAAPTAAAAAEAKIDMVSVAAVDFPASSLGDAQLQVRPVVMWGKDAISVSIFVRCKQLTPAASGTPGNFIFSYSKRVFGSTVLDFALSSPAGLKAHLKGDVIETNVSLSAHKWQHILITWYSRDGTLTMYIDGNKAFSASKLRVGAHLEQGGAFLLGNTTEGATHAFVGMMAEVSVWKVVLEREFVRKMSQKPVLKGSEDNLCLYFNFKGISEDDSSLILDVSSEREGQLRGGAAVLKKPVVIRGGDSASGGGGEGGGAGGGSSTKFESTALRFEERSFGRLVTSPPAHLTTHELSLAMWLCSADSLQSGTILSWVWPNKSGKLCRIELRDATNVEITIGSETAGVRSKVAINDGRWHFVVVTWKSKDGALSLLVDGTEKFVANGISQGLRLDERAANAAKLGGSGTLVIGQRLRDLSKRGVCDLEEAYFGLVAHFSVWCSALSASSARKMMTGPLEGVEKDLTLYLNPDSAQFRSRILADVAQAKQGQKLSWKALGYVDMLPAEGLAPSHPSPAALPVLDRQIKRKTVTLEARTGARLALQPLSLSESPSNAILHLSVCVWLMVSKDKKLAGGECLFSYDRGPTEEGGGGGIALMDSSNLTISADGQDVKTGCRLQAGVWYHVCLTWRAEDGASCLYVNTEKKWEGKIAKGAVLTGEQASLWVGQHHSWDVLNNAKKAGVPLPLLCSLLYSTNKEQAAQVLLHEEAAKHVGKLKEVADKALVQPTKGGDSALAGAIYEWFCKASCFASREFVGQVAELSVWHRNNLNANVSLYRVLSKSDLSFVSNGALLGNELGLVSYLDVARYLEEDKSVPDRFFDELTGAAVGGCKLGEEVELRAGPPWVFPLAPGTTPKEAGDMCALQLDKEGGACVLSDSTLCSGEGEGAGGELSLSFWIRTIDTRTNCEILSFATAAAPKEVHLSCPGALELHIAGNVLSTGVAINDGHWHHVALVWKGKTFKDKDGQEHKGELVVYVNNVVLYRGAGQNKGAKEISTSAGTFSLGSGGGGGSSCEAVLASVAVLSRCLDVKGVSILFETPPLRGTEKGLLLYYDFDFEVSDEKPAQEVLNRARKAKAKGGSCGLLKGSARLVFLMVPYQLQKVSKVAHVVSSSGSDSRGEFKAKCLAFKDKTAEGCAFLYPAEIIPEMVLSLMMWVRSDDIKGQGTVVSYAAHCRKAFILRIAHKGSDEKETTQLVRVDGAMQFVQLIAKLKETFDELVTFRHTLAGGEPVTVSSEADFDDFCVLVQKMESEEPSTDLTPATAGKKERQKAVAVSSAPFKGGAKLIATPIDPSKLAKMVEMEELCITRPVDLEIAIKGQRCKGDSPININDGRWHHIALTWQSRGGQLIMYVDGNVRLSKTGVLQDARLSTGGCIAFGQSQSSIAKDFKKGSAFQGQVAQVSIWKKILPRSRVLRSMSLPMTGNEDGLVFLWDFAVDPVSGGGQIFNSSSYVQSAGSSAVSSVKGQIRDRAALWWGDATLPGEARTCGLGNPNDKSAYVRINVKCSKLSETLLADTAIKTLFFHVVVGEEGNDMEHALRHGSFPCSKNSFENTSHEQVLHVDELGHRRQRKALQALICNTSSTAEALLQVHLCRETVTRVGDVLSEVVAKGTVDMLEILNAGRDELDKELRLRPPGKLAASKGSKVEATAVVLLGIEAVAALRALTAAHAKEIKSSAISSHAAAPSSDPEEIPKFERKHSNFSRSSSVATSSVPLSQKPKLPSSTSPKAPIAEAPALAPASSIAARAPAPAHAPAPAPAPATDAEKKKKDDDNMDLPERIILNCKRSGGQTTKIEMDFDLTWPKAQKVLEKELGGGRCIEFVESKSKQSFRVDQPKFWEKLRMQCEDNFDTDTGDAHLEVKIVSSADVQKDDSTAKLISNAAAKAVRSKGTNADDNPDEYYFVCDCSQLGPGWWVDSVEVKVTVSAEILWEDFRNLLTTKFGAPVLISFINLNGKVVPLKTKEDFDDACDQIEDEWDEADGDGSIQCVLQPPKTGMSIVKGQGAVTLRVPVGDERTKLQVFANNVAGRMRERSADVCSAILKKETSEASCGVSGKGAGELKGITSQQALATIFSKKVLEGQGEEVLQALEKLVMDDDMLLALESFANSDQEKSKIDTKPHTEDRLIDWMSFVDRFRLATSHEALVMHELQDATLRVALNGVYIQRQALRYSSVASGGNGSWDTCDKLLRDECSLTEDQIQRLKAWAKAREVSQEVPPVPDLMSLAEEAQLVDVGSIIGEELLESMVLRVLKKRTSVEAAIAKVTLPKKSSESKGVKLSLAVEAVARAAGLSLAGAQSLLLRNASILSHVAAAQDDQRTAEETTETETEIEMVVVDEVVLEGWLEKLWILHPGEIETLERARDNRRQIIRRALVAQKDALVKGICACASDNAPKKESSEGAGVADSKSAKKSGIVGIQEAIVTACQREGVVCSQQEAQAVVDEVPMSSGSRDVASWVIGLQLVDIVTGTLDSHSEDLCPKIAIFLDACDRIDRSDRAHSLLFPSQLMQALLSVGVPITVADMLVQQSAHHAGERVDYRDLVCGRLLVLSERERLRLATPMARNQNNTRVARLRLMERKAHLMASFAQHDSLGRGFVDESQALAVLQNVLQLSAQDSQSLLDIVAGPSRSVVAVADAAARKIDYRLLGGFRTVMARPAVAAFCMAGCSGCMSVAETFLSRQSAVMKALREACARWRKSKEGSAVSAVWGIGVLPYSEFEEVLRNELCGRSVAGGEWKMRHVRSLALAERRLVVDANFFATGKDRTSKAEFACHLVRVEGMTERFAALESSDAAALRRLASLPHQRALATAHSARHQTSAQTSQSAPMWETLRNANSAATLLLAISAAFPTDDSGEKTEDGLPCGDFEALLGIWGGGMSLEALLGSLVPVYCHMLPAYASAMVGLTKAKKISKTNPTSAGGAAKGGVRVVKAATAGGSAEGLTRGQQIFRKLLAGRRPGVMHILQAMGAMPPTCVPSPLKDTTKQYAIATNAYTLANLDPSSIRCLQLQFIEAVGVPGPGERYEAKNRMLKACLFDAYMMKFVGPPLYVQLTVPKDEKPQSMMSWTPTKTAPKIFVSTDLKTHAQMYLYLELGQLSQRKSDTAGKEIMDVSCGHALMALKDLPTGSIGKKELAISGGTPFMPKVITKDLLDTGKSSGFLSRLRGTAKKSELTIKLEKVDKHTLEMVLFPPPFRSPAYQYCSDSMIKM